MLQFALLTPLKSGVIYYIFKICQNAPDARRTDEGVLGIRLGGPTTQMTCYEKFLLVYAE